MKDLNNDIWWREYIPLTVPQPPADPSNLWLCDATLIISAASLSEIFRSVQGLEKRNVRIH